MVVKRTRVKRSLAVFIFLLFTSISMFFVEPVAPDEPFNNTDDLGYELLDNGTVFHMWNQHNSYYFNRSNGVQFSNHYEEYWTKNVLMLGYYAGEQWNLLHRNDQLSGFTEILDYVADDYINVTLWKNLSYIGYNYRLAIRYHLGVNDSDLTVIPYIKNIGTNDITIPIAFGWEMKDITIDNTIYNNYIRINSTEYLLNQTLDKKYTNLTWTSHHFNETSGLWENTTYPNSRFTFYNNVTGRDLYLRWNYTLDYLVWVKNRTGQYNAPTTLFIRVGTLDVDQEKYTIMYWLDADNWVNPTTAESLGAWQNTDNAKDGNTETWAVCGESDFYLWCNKSMTSDKLRVYCCYDDRVEPSDATNVDIDVYYSGSWHVLATDTTIPFNTATEYIYSGGTSFSIAGMRIRGVLPELEFHMKYVQFNDTTVGDTTPPEIIINFAGNLSDSGGPFWRPPGESTALTGVWSDGYITNDSRHSENGTYINLTVTDDTGVGAVWLQWLNRSAESDTWTNWTYAFSNPAGNWWEYNTSGIIETYEGYNYSFDIVANDTADPVNSNISCHWNKTGIGGGMTRRWVQLNCTPINISYSPYYLYNATYESIDYNKADRLHHDQGGNNYALDTGYLLSTTPTDTIITNRVCTSFNGYWFDESVCILPFTLTNFYYNVWWSTQTGSITVGWNKSREHLDELTADNYTTSAANNRSQIYYDDGGLFTNHTYSLETNLFSVTSTDFTDNDIYEIAINFIALMEEPSTISNRSFTSFIIPNVPTDILDGTDNTTDTDGDGLSDHMELNTTYGVHTNPFLADTDNDGVDDCDECKSGSDPNNYTSTTANTPPTITGEIPANQSVGISTTPILNVTVDDANDNTLDVYWYSNSSGTWVLFDTNISIDTSGGEVNISQTNTNFTANNQIYWWSVNASDGCLWTNETYHFTTIAVGVNNPPVQTSPCIWNVTTSENKSLNATNVDLFPTSFNVTVNDTDGNYMNVTIMTNESGSWTTINTTASGMLNGTFQSYNTSWVDSYSTKYWICFNVSDDEDWDNETYNFTTTCSLVFDINRTSFGFGVVQNDTMIYSNATEPDTFKIYNNGTCSIDIDINGTNATATGVTDWNLSSNNGDNQYKMEIYNSSTNWNQVNKTASTWYGNMAQSTNIMADVRITTPTVFYSGKQMTCTIYMTASIH